MKTPHPQVRRGVSLIEVLLATAILLGSAVVLGELASMGRRQSEKGKKLAEAQQLCEQTLHEVLLGLRPLEPLEQEPLLPAKPRLEDATGRPFEDLVADFEPFPIDAEATLPASIAESSPAARPEWVHSLRVAPLDDHPGLAVLTVVVEQPPETTVRPVRFELSRWIDDPLGAAGDGSPDPVSGPQPANQGSVIP